MYQRLFFKEYLHGTLGFQISHWVSGSVAGGVVGVVGVGVVVWVSCIHERNRSMPQVLFFLGSILSTVWVRVTNPDHISSLGPKLGNVLPPSCVLYGI